MSRLLLLALLFLPPAARAEGSVTGPARATAAETLVIAGTRFRLAGVAAPDAERRCGMVSCAEAARARLAALAGTGPVTCTRGSRLGHGVYQGTCRLADGRDLARLLVEEGLLVPAP